MQRRTIAALLATTALLAARADEATRREFLYKPAYCLAGGLANMGSEACLPQPLKDKADAVASAKQSVAQPATPAADATVYYTDDQRMVMSYAIARALFAPSAKLIRSSATMSLEASNVIEPPPANTTCRADKARADVIHFVRGQITDAMVNRDTAQFLAENYTDLQLTELYRVAKTGGQMDAVTDAPFVMPDPKHPGQSLNVKPKGGSALGGILSYTTSRVASRVVDERRAHIDAILKERTALHRARAAKNDSTCADETVPTEAKASGPAATATTAKE